MMSNTEHPFVPDLINKLQAHSAEDPKAVEEATAELYDFLKEELLRAATLHGSLPRHEAAVAANYAFFKIWRCITQGPGFVYRGDRAFFAWARRIARRCALDELKRLPKEVSLETLWDQRHFDPPDPANDFAQTEVESPAAMMKRAGLNQEEQQVLGFFATGGLPVHEIADRMGLPGPKISQILYRARRKMAGYLGRQ